MGARAVTEQLLEQLLLARWWSQKGHLPFYKTHIRKSSMLRVNMLLHVVIFYNSGKTVHWFVVLFSIFFSKSISACLPVG